MSIDDLINNAFKNRGGHIEGANLHALVGSVTTQETFVVMTSSPMSKQLKVEKRGVFYCQTFDGFDNFSDVAGFCSEAAKGIKFREGAPGRV